MNYKRKPIVVQALQWTGDNFELIREFCGHGDKALAQQVDGDIKLMSLDGYMTAHVGDYIILNQRGEIYPCNQSSFRDIYEKI